MSRQPEIRLGDGTFLGHGCVPERGAFDPDRPLIA